MNKTEYFKSFDRKRLTHQRYGEQRIAKGLREQIDTIIEVLPQAGAGALLASLDQFSKIEPLERAYQDLYGRVGGDFARDQFQRLTGKSKKAESDWIEYMRNFALNQAGARIKQVSEVTLKRIRQVLEQGISEGLGIEDIARNMERSNAVNRVRARVIARTEIISASNAGADLGARSTGLNLNKEWLTSIDGREREAHALANGQKVAMDEDFIVDGEQCKYPGDPNLSAENVIQCFTGDTKVSFDSCKKTIRSSYSGKLITVKTSRGHEFTATPNHPVMTDRGLIRLDEVNHSTNLICCPLNKNITGDLDVNNIPSTFKKFHDSFSVIFMVMRVSRINVNLYSRIPDSEVDIVNVDGFLWNYFKSFLLKFFSKGIFKVSNFSKALFFCFSLFYRLFDMKLFRHISHSFISRLDLVRSFFIRHLRPFKRLRFGLCSDMNATPLKPLSYDVTTDRKLFSNSIFAIPTGVQRNNLINIERNLFTRGVVPFFESSVNELTADTEELANIGNTFSRFVHIDNPVFIDTDFVHNKEVYTLETDEGIYNAGGVIASNCRCVHLMEPI